MARDLKPVAEAGSLRFVRATKLAEEGFTGEIVRGLYIKSTPNALNESRSDYTIEEESTGELVIVNGAGNLGYQMDKVAPGAFVAISYNGQSTMTKGKFKGKSVHNFTVLAEDLEATESAS